MRVNYVVALYIAVANITFVAVAIYGDLECQGVVENNFIRHGFVEYQADKITGEVSVVYKEKGIRDAIKGTKKSS